MSMDVEQIRFNMVEQQVRPWEVTNARVLAALTDVPRERYVPVAYRSLAFADVALPLAHGESMMKPVLDGRILQAVDVEEQDSVLEVGTGSGFLTACLAYLGRDVESVELHADLADLARQNLLEARVANVQIRHADALSAGFSCNREFDVIVLGGAVAVEPAGFRKLLKPAGRLFFVRGEGPAMEAVLITRTGASEFREQSLFETELPYLRGAEPKKQFVL
ncbi:protein-L-isoaspartate O-methyltransferase [Ahniella affigens]|uniref:Protein-L-isoaspartate O-methyltransferase n=1 Tax=Ahniella affigens TaxID=2021234 RepID=A0A2P1PTB7_9GAMM|nr:protein-L-isoaspartate O-methyltransferase [Ahniella affigens]AVP98060.1 protein-L-isoaspartate O-methyltransferase [Ahniella affigens]